MPALGSTADRLSKLAAAVGALVLAAWVQVAPSQVIEEMPDEIQDVGIDDRRGEQIPLDLKFTTENGELITLAELFNGERPVLLSLNYSDCPMLCKVQLNGLCAALKEMDWTAGDEFHVVSVSIDPRESPQRAKQTEQRYLTDYGREGSADGWHFLTSNQDNITALAKAVGFRYKYLPEQQDYAHTAAVMVCTPEGVVSRYLYGVMYEPQTVRLSLVEAANGRIGSAVDQLILFCFHYDETKGRYGPVARNIMSAGAGLTVLALAAGLLPYWVRRAGRGTSAPKAEPTASSTTPPAHRPDTSQPVAT